MVSPWLNARIMAGFLENYQRNDVRKTHLFEGRYENIYLNTQHIPELSALIDEAIGHAENFLQLRGLRAGYWFNFMPPGAVTTLHRHDDDDELLSAVYYVDATKNTGNLIIHDNTGGNATNRIEIVPESGEFVFFKPDVPHEVSRNKSNTSRLSIGINFGIPEK